MTAGQVIENPLSGGRVTIRRTAAQTGGALLAWELKLASGDPIRRCFGFQRGVMAGSRSQYGRPTQNRAR